MEKDKKIENKEIRKKEDLLHMKKSATANRFKAIWNSIFGRKPDYTMDGLVEENRLA